MFRPANIANKKTKTFDSNIKIKPCRIISSHHLKGQGPFSSFCKMIMKKKIKMKVTKNRPMHSINIIELVSLIEASEGCLLQMCIQKPVIYLRWNIMERN